ncbi:hypothetical protein Mal64_11980 [Pseudobythopirellula maris]|uniref:DUF985 domain-containing protein n=1 Tax=Pseudobythopirellula maris TaxID=2527991 RepID=A0A5C5ZV49_9BACT|nr:cupin domain-containing protein [Pseudobythopirellula maris]TWT90801.1 hypothetical protein Mal64_11980 [Pseudobythopirellula maris]
MTDKSQAPNDTPMTASEVIDLLGLVPLPEEGGFYNETFRSPMVLGAEGLPDDYDGTRNASTTIYFLMTPEEHSAWHILPSDEVFHHYTGDPVAMLLLPPEGAATQLRLGPDLRAGERPQAIVPGNTWQACRLADREADTPSLGWALLGCNVAPGFDFKDFHVATPHEVDGLAARFSQVAEEVRRLAPRNDPP